MKCLDSWLPVKTKAKDITNSWGRHRYHMISILGYLVDLGNNLFSVSEVVEKGDFRENPMPKNSSRIMCKHLEPRYADPCAKSSTRATD